MPSVNLIQFSEPRPQPAQGNPTRAGDPFGELLASTSASQMEPGQHARQTEARQEPAAPRTRGEARREALHRDQGSDDAIRAADTDRAAHDDVSELQAAERDATQGDDIPDNETSDDSEGQAPQVAAQSDEAAEKTGDEPVTGENPDPAVAESDTEIASTSVSAGEPETGDVAMFDEGDELADDGPMTASSETDAPVTDLAAEFVEVPAAETSDAETGEIPAALPVADGEPEPSTEGETPLTAGEADPEGTDDVAAQAVASPAPGAPSTEPDNPAPAPVQTSATRPAGEQSQTQSPAPGNATPQNAANDAATKFGDGTNEQSTQKQPDMPAAPARASDGKPQDARPQEFKPATPADAVKPAAPATDTAATRPQPDTLPEPVRALAATLNPASVNSITFRNVALNERAPVPLTGTALAAEIISRMRDGMRRFDIRLDPPELGRVDVRLEVDRTGNVKTRLTVDRPETLDLMQREARGLERALQQAGLKTDSGGLEFTLRSHAENSHGEGRPEQHGREANPFGDDGLERADAAIDSYRAAAYARGGVDIRI